MPLDRKWLFTKENDFVIERNKKRNISPKKKKTKKRTGKRAKTGDNDEDSSVATCQSSNTIVTTITEKETKRADLLKSLLEKNEHRKYPAGGPGGHISRDLNINTCMSLNVDYSTTSQLFQLSTDTSKLLTFQDNKALSSRRGPLPPLEWDNRLYPPCQLFVDMTPRQGGYYPDDIVSKRKEVRHKPVIKKPFSIREDVKNSIDSSSANSGDMNDSVLSDSTTENETYEQLLHELLEKGKDITLNDLSLIAKLRNPHEYVNLIFRYIHILILGFDQKRKASTRDFVNGAGGEPNASQTLLKECSPLLLYLQHVSDGMFPNNVNDTL